MKYNKSLYLLIGFGQQDYFNGAIDEVRVWNKAIAPDETVTMKQII